MLVLITSDMGYLRQFFESIRSSKSVLIGSIIFLTVFSILPFQAPLATVFILLYILLFSYLLGSRYFSNIHEALSWLMGFLLLIAYYVVTCTVFLYTFELTPPIFSLLMLFSPILLLPLRKIFLQGRSGPKSKEIHIVLNRFSIFRIAYLVLAFLLVFILFKAQTVESTVSPWLLTPSLFFIYYFVLITILFALFYLDKKISWLYFVPIYFLVLSVAVIVFPLGYGFDPFIHQATEKILIASGTITPLPLYYSGYYSLIAFLHHVSNISITLLDTYIVPTLASLLIPLTIVGVMRYYNRERIISYLLPFVFILVPYSELVQSTPQALSYLWAFTLIMLSRLYITTLLIRWWMLLVIAVTALLFHPITGIPLILFTMILYLYKHRTDLGYFRRFLLIVSGFLGVVTLPIAFLLIGQLSNELQVSLVMPPVEAIFSQIREFWIPFSRFDDLIYLFDHYAPLLFVVLAVLGLHYEHRSREKGLFPFTAAFIILQINYFILTRFLSFDFATVNEQNIFAQRVMRLSFYFLMPAIFSGAYYILLRVRKHMHLVPVFFTILVGLFITASLYLSYPRFDTKAQSKGYTASQHDNAAVQWILNDAENEPYIVLANQTVSAVAVKKFGFKHYYNNIFYYPLPTNGPLYRHYLALTDPKSDYARILSDIENDTGVSRIYLIVNNYWDNAELIRDRFLSIASRHFTIGGNAIDVFVFEVGQASA